MPMVLKPYAGLGVVFLLEAKAILKRDAMMLLWVLKILNPIR